MPDSPIHIACGPIETLRPQTPNYRVHNPVNLELLAAGSYAPRPLISITLRSWPKTVQGYLWAQPATVRRIPCFLTYRDPGQTIQWEVDGWFEREPGYGGHDLWRFRYPRDYGAQRKGLPLPRSADWHQPRIEITAPTIPARPPHVGLGLNSADEGGAPHA